MFESDALDLSLSGSAVRARRARVCEDYWRDAASDYKTRANYLVARLGACDRSHTASEISVAALFGAGRVEAQPDVVGNPGSRLVHQDRPQQIGDFGALAIGPA